MDQEKRDELLIRIDERVHQLTKCQLQLSNKANSDIGFTRCQVHRNEVSTMVNSFKNLKKLLWGSIATFLLAIGIDFFMRK